MSNTVVLSNCIAFNVNVYFRTSMQQTRMAGPQFMEPAIMVDWDVYNFLISGEPVSMKLITQGIPQVGIYII